MVTVAFVRVKRKCGRVYAGSVVVGTAGCGDGSNGDPPPAAVSGSAACSPNGPLQGSSAALPWADGAAVKQVILGAVDTIPPGAGTDLDELRALIREIPDYPEPGVVFKDITPVLADARGLAAAVTNLTAPFIGQVDLVAGIEARGFILGAPVALALGAGFVPLRKLGKLPGPTVAVGYTLEYGQATLEVHVDALAAGERVLIVDDVVATGGTARAAVNLVRRAGGTVVGLSALLEIERLGGRARLDDIPVHTVLAG